MVVRAVRLRLLAREWKQIKQVSPTRSNLTLPTFPQRAEHRRVGSIKKIIKYEHEGHNG
jgi:hypothetical protein